MMSTKNHGNERSLGNKYETTAIVSEEGIRSEASMQFNPINAFPDLAREDRGVEEFHYMQVFIQKGMRCALDKTELGEDQKLPELEDTPDDQLVQLFKEEQDFFTENSK